MEHRPSEIFVAEVGEIIASYNLEILHKTIGRQRIVIGVGVMYLGYRIGKSTERKIRNYKRKH